MDKKSLSIIGGIILVIGVAVGGYFLFRHLDTSGQNNTSQTNTNDANKEEEETDDDTVFVSEKDVSITVTSLKRGDKVSSPLKVEGKVPGSWSHEGQFSVRLLDGNSNVLVEEPATLDGEWMTESMVAFTANLEFEAPSEGLGLLVLEKANPSGLEENADSVTVQIAF